MRSQNIILVIKTLANRDYTIYLIKSKNSNPFTQPPLESRLLFLAPRLNLHVWWVFPFLDLRRTKIWIIQVSAKDPDLVQRGSVLVEGETED